MEVKKDKNTLYYMWKMITYRPWLYLCNCILWTIIHISPLIPGLLAKEFFDNLSGNASLNVGIWGLLVLMIVVTLMRVVFITIGGRVDIIHRFNMSGLIRRNLLQGILDKPGAASIACSAGEAVNCFRDDADQAENSISWTLDVIGSAVFALVAIIILLNINVKITLLVFTPLVLVVALAQRAGERIEKYREASRDATANVTGAMGEIFSSVQAIKVAGAEKDILKNLNKLNKVRHTLTLKDSILNQLMQSIYENTVSFGTGLILLLVGQSIRTGNFTVGDFALFIYYLTFVADFTQFFGSFIAHYQQTGVALRRMIQLLQERDGEGLVKHSPLYLKVDPEEKIKNETLKEEGNTKILENLKIKDLTYTYEGAGSGIKNVSFNINKGDFTVITGRIGSGKSTLVKTLLGLLPKESGEVYWNNSKVEAPAEFFIPPISAYTSQVPNLFSDTVKENILLGIKENLVELNKAINSAVLERDIETLPRGLETIIGSKGVKLSGGQIQRTAAARMFARKAELYVFDDISSALDVDTEVTLWNRLFNDDKPTCLVVSNRKFVLQHADNIIVMREGKIEAQGTLEVLLENSEEMKQIWSIIQ
ncbi:ABC transporter ATP-binding protein [Clostridium tunisiense]|uniref:ABC transporter ATP-binding protein n=1 Tax=Clostridium tunisiense TaxID=219748 RepID=UPI0003150D57|nr:ABC transporter ATP-binding protein [Clostridium tunisiense]